MKLICDDVADDINFGETSSLALKGLRKCPCQAGTCSGFMFLILPPSVSRSRVIYQQLAAI
jgi:hypothetical protein